jgi:V8-like Glu-specific endopeptidase
MKKNRNLNIFACLALALAAITPTLAESYSPTALNYPGRLIDAAALPAREAPAVDLEVVTIEDEQRELAGLAPRYAIPNPVSITPDSDGLWEELAPGTLVWRLRVASPGAHSLNLGFGRYDMPPEGRLFVYASDFSHVIRPFTSQDNALHGELWTPVVISDEIVIEVTLPAEVADELSLELTSINVGYRGFETDGATKSGACNVDVVCPDGDGWRSEIPAIGNISTGGSLFCTGFMVNNTAEDYTPYFMTAYHCGIASYNAASLVVYWNHEASTCGGPRDGSLSQFQTGSYFRAQYSSSDFTLVELDQDPNPDWGITYAGWDRSGNNATTAVAIHHPRNDEKAISFEYQNTTTTSYLGTSVPGNGTHVRVIDWDVGTTEPGSSGSPLFNQNHHVIGQLHGGYAACSNNSSDWYGRFSVSWTGGGTSSSRLSNWLDPGNTGATSVDTLGGGDPGCGNGLCDSGEDCNSCPADCIRGGGASGCGNGVCEPNIGEDCLSCADDCRGKINGKPSNRYCCGDGDGQNPVGCGDSRCTQSPWACSNTPPDPYCCGDATCEGAETGCNCAIDCGAPPTYEVEYTTCDDGLDNDCDGGADCSDPHGDCAGDPFCDVTCGVRGDPCSENIDCCSNRCHRGACK